jgi:hypothetical protein
MYAQAAIIESYLSFVPKSKLLYAQAALSCCYGDGEGVA